MKNVHLFIAIILPSLSQCLADFNNKKESECFQLTEAETRALKLQLFFRATKITHKKEYI
jgi:hypothetical protein